MPEGYREILVVDLLGGMGDLLMVLPAVHALAREHPGGNVRVLTHEPGAQLIRADPLVAEVRVPRSGEQGAERAAVEEALADVRPDLAVTTTRYDGIPDLLRAGARRCVDDLWRHPPPDQEVAARYLEILGREGVITPGRHSARPVVRPTDDELEHGRRLLTSAVDERSGRPVVLVPEAGMPVKRWPARHWRSLVHLLTAQGRAVLSLTEIAGTRVPVLPRTSLRRLAAVFCVVAARQGAVVGGDTGPLRLAAAAGAATVALFGPTAAARYGLRGVDLQGLPGCEHRRPTAITEQVCWWDARCPLSDRGPACMSDIRPDAVAALAVRDTVRMRHDPAPADGAAPTAPANQSDPWLSDESA